MNLCVSSTLPPGKPCQNLLCIVSLNCTAPWKPTACTLVELLKCDTPPWGKPFGLPPSLPCILSHFPNLLYVLNFGFHYLVGHSQLLVLLVQKDGHIHCIVSLVAHHSISIWLAASSCLAIKVTLARSRRTLLALENPIILSLSNASK